MKVSNANLEWVAGRTDLTTYEGWATDKAFGVAVADLVADLREARTAMQTALEKISAQQWQVAHHIRGTGMPVWWCPQCGNLREEGHRPDDDRGGCATWQAIAALLGALGETAVSR